MISIPASEETVASGFNSTSIIEISLNSSFNYSYAPFLEENATTNSSKDMFSNLTESSNSIVFPAYIRITSMIFCVIIMCLGVIGNIMVPVVIFKTKDMRNSTNIFLVNLSIADLMVLLVCTPTVLVEVNSKPETWVLGEEMCKAVPFVELTVAHASVLTILAISFERYYAICKPLKAGYICTKARASLICLLAWLVAALCTSPILAITQYDLEQYYDGTIVSVCFSSVQTLLPSLFFILTVSAFFFIPLVILIIIYLLIAVTLMEQPHILAAPRKDSSNQSSLGAIKYRKQVVIMLGTVVLAFFICLLPFRALTLWIIIVPAESIMSLGLEGYYNLLYFSRIMFHINSAINPILYNIMSSKFRNGFFKLCHVKSLKKRRGGRGTWIFRKSTITTTSTNTTSQSTSESFWNRYSNRTSSSSKSAIKDNAPKTVCSSQNNKEKSYIRIPLQNLNNISILKMIRCESYV